MSQYRNEVCACGHQWFRHEVVPIWKFWIWMRGAARACAGRCEACPSERVCQRFVEQPVTPELAEPDSRFPTVAQIMEETDFSAATIPLEDVIDDVLRKRTCGPGAGVPLSAPVTLGVGHVARLVHALAPAIKPEKG